MFSLFDLIHGSIWPFVKEIVLKGKTVRESLKDNKKGVAFLFYIVLVHYGVFRLFVVSGEKVTLNNEYVILQKKYEELQGSKRNPIHDGVELKQNTDAPKKVAPAQVPVRKEEKNEGNMVIVRSDPPPRRQPKANQNNERYRRFQETLESIRQREEAEEKRLQ